MANKMLIDATHPEETRVVVLRGNRVEEFDFESAHRKQLRGNIYLAKVTRVEPSLQAAFVDYGGNRHGFLAFSEIHPDYYQIPVADREALIAEEERAQRAADDEVDRRSRRHRRQPAHQATRRDATTHGDVAEAHSEDSAGEHFDPAPGENGDAAEVETVGGGADASSADHDSREPVSGTAQTISPDALNAGGHDDEDDEASEPLETLADTATGATTANEISDAEHSEAELGEAELGEAEDDHAAEHIDDHGDEIASAGSAENGEPTAVTEVHEHDDNGEDGEAAEEIVESVGGSDAMEEVPDRSPRYRRQYKIQEVIKRRQVMLVQVVKEERGTKGAALTTYLSLAGRYSVLMPNTARGGGISRKITSSEDRARLKEAASELEVPEGMGVILRTAGASRTKIEIKRDFEYLLRMWETVRDLTLKSTAPKLVYEEGSLVKRSIRDLYTKDIDDVIVAGPEAYNEAKDFMRMLMPSHAKNVKPYADTQPLLSRYGVENQLDAMFSPVVQLRSGGYIVLNQAEALVAIDVNSGRATREHHIEDTALKTNLEAADEISRQLRLRDLAGLIVIDFIDMDEKRNNRSVERRLKECLKHDRARIQVGRISHFGLLEMSRQRIRSSVLESSTEKCPYCGGSGHVRSVSSLALQVLRALEEQLMKGATHNLIARTRPDVALYVLNQKRAHLRGLEERFAITLTISGDESVMAPQAFVIDRGEQVHTPEAAKALAERTQANAAPLEDEDDLEDFVAAEDESADEAASPATVPEQGEGGPRRRRRRRRRGGRNGGETHEQGHEQEHDHAQDLGHEHEHVPISGPADDFAADGERQASADDESGEPHGEFAPQDRGENGDPSRDGGERRRRRGRRGGRRNRQRNGDGGYDRNRPDNQHDSQPDNQEAPEPSFAPAEELIAPPSTEPELRHTVADLDSGPPARREAPVSAGAPPATPASPPTAEPEPPRRRSTVRERAPVGNSDDVAAAPPPLPTPVPTVTETSDAAEGDQPRRTGWWSRRFAGG
ncbi:MAG TPA: Rne/Rng family ribonuclease [Xanthobacteraceae bacterium]|jgi:ribonuclease E|nr:Rne/Rng family ribonuclease [Xanthobacteraceae bacterium]